MSSYAERRSCLLERFDIDAFLVAHVDSLLADGVDRKNLFYLSGFSGSGILLVSKKGSVLLTDARYLERARRSIEDTELFEKPLGDDYLEAALALVRKRSPLRLGFSARKTSYAVGSALSKRLSGQEVIALADPVESLRVRKDPEEISAIKQAIELTEICLAHIAETARPGDTEATLRRQLQQIVTESDAEFAFDPIIASGPNSAIAHHVPANRILRNGDLVIVDIGVQASRYAADLTRTFHIGAAPAEVIGMYDAVLQAQEAGIAALGPGVPIQAARAAMQEAFASSPFLEFSRVSGHGLGLEVHEPPYIRQQSNHSLSAGTVLTVEPGIYIPGMGGIRIEDDVLITDNGYSVLSSFPKGRLMKIG